MARLVDEKTTVIIAVYNHFNWLRLILDALGHQSVSGFEVVIADDGSSPETVERILRYADEHPALDIKHSWIPDKGWRKNISLNQAVRVASGEYLIFVDGDCVPHPRFVEDHLELRRHGGVVAGRRVDMPQFLSDEFEKMESLRPDYFSYACRRILTSPFSQPIGEMFSQLKRTVRLPIRGHRSVGMKYGGILGCNFSLYKEDLESVNGFDERYLDPGTGEDTDLDERLQNAGIMPVKVSRNALMLHRRHKRLVFDSPRNKALFEAVRREKLTYITTGLRQNS